MEIPLKGILAGGSVGTQGNSSQIMEVRASIFAVYGESICGLEGFMV